MKLSNQAMGAIMMALQKSLLEQTDIVPVLESFEFTKSGETNRWGTKNGELVVKNPPNFKVDNIDMNTDHMNEEVTTTTGSD
tara:strand:+ start:24 stop:269 length:246 start_codon:yes stop_codon:yes gene_type:complete